MCPEGYLKLIQIQIHKDSFKRAPMMVLSWFYKIHNLQKETFSEQPRAHTNLKLFLSKWLLQAAVHTHNSFNTTHGKQGFQPCANLLLFVESSLKFPGIFVHSVKYAYLLSPTKRSCHQKECGLPCKNHPLLFSRGKYIRKYLRNTPCKI